MTDLAGTSWDVVVIGAGPAGSIAAMQLAADGWRVLLVDRKAFPRAKVCGGCLNARALHDLRGLDLLRLAWRASGAPVRRLQVRAGSAVVETRLPPGLAICRSEWDRLLVEEARRRGASFLSGVAARVVPQPGIAGPLRQHEVHLDLGSEGGGSIGARLVVLAGGLQSASFVAPHLLTMKTAPTSRIGVGGCLPAGTLHAEPEKVTMSVTRSGYVGRVVLRDGRQVVAAALDREYVRQAGNLPRAVAGILGETSDEPFAKHLQGTPPLTRSLACPAAERLLVIGDAAGYVEPFLGEGMATAVTTATAVVPFIRRGLECGTEGLARDWAREHRRLTRSKRAWCHAFAMVSRSPPLTQVAMALANVVPRVPRWIARQISRPAAADHAWEGSPPVPSQL